MINKETSLFKYNEYKIIFILLFLNKFIQLLMKIVSKERY